MNRNGGVPSTIHEKSSNQEADSQLTIKQRVNALSGGLAPPKLANMQMGKVQS